MYQKSDYPFKLKYKRSTGVTIQKLQMDKYNKISREESKIIEENKTWNFIYGI